MTKSEYLACSELRATFHLPVTLANSLTPYQDRQSMGPDLDPNLAPD